MSITNEPTSVQSPPPLISEDSTWGTFVPPKDITTVVVKTVNDPVGSGGYADIYKGSYKSDLIDALKASFSHKNDVMEVAIKVMRPGLLQNNTADKLKKRLGREIALWQRLNHENIQGFLGISTAFGPFPSTISQWQKNGTIKTYLANFPEANRWELIRGIASGLAYLHANDPQITHGDIKPDNILVTDWGCPCLSDFGISAVHDETAFWMSSNTRPLGTARYMSPELLNGSAKKITAASDTYAFGITAYEIMTGLVPFHIYSMDVQVIVAVVNRQERPARPDEKEAGEMGLTNELWAVIEDSWASEQDARPVMQDLEERMIRICASERSLRLLSIDGNGISVVGALTCLDQIMKEIGPTAKPCDHFDMIAGSGGGGLVALMLGRLRMSIADCRACIEEPLKNLYNVTVEKQIKRVAKEKFRFTWHDLQEYLRPIVNNLLTKEHRSMLDTVPRACKTFVIANDISNPFDPPRLRTYRTRNEAAFPHRIWVAMSATMCTPTSFEQIFGENFSMENFNNVDAVHFNPAADLLDEARRVFGEHKRVGCLVSVGSGLASEEWNIDGPSQLTTMLHHASDWIGAAHKKVQEQCDPGSYYRFDPKISGLSEEAWKEVMMWEQFDGPLGGRAQLEEAARAYMTGDEEVRRAKECATRLERPVHLRSSTGTSFVSLRSLDDALPAVPPRSG